ncbi:MAG: hypothetical protein DLM70_01875 [Chloroflexi bacterium]|nr:MAG: hypothetical protein DLM70_01875 [Chloroflexota bacterium]
MLAFPSGPRSNDRVAIQRAVVGARVTWRTGAIVPRQYGQGRIPAWVTRRMLGAARIRCANHYVRPALTLCQKTLALEIQEDARGRFLVLGGALESIHFTDVTGGFRTRVTARTVESVRLGRREGAHVTITVERSTVDWSFVLVKVGRGWRISREDFVFAPGTGP